MPKTDPSNRKRPNILITGTPGTGKTYTATSIADQCSFHHVDISSIIEASKCHLEYDATLETHVLDEDALLDILEEQYFDYNEYFEGGLVADYHSSSLFPERWFDLVIVLKCSTEVLFDRLTKRGYNDKKRSENIQAEIMRVVADEALESYAKEIVVEIDNNSIEDADSLLDRVNQWHQAWLNDR